MRVGVSFGAWVRGCGIKRGWRGRGGGSGARGSCGKLGSSPSRSVGGRPSGYAVRGFAPRTLDSASFQFANTSSRSSFNCFRASAVHEHMASGQDASDPSGACGFALEHMVAHH